MVLRRHDTGDVTLVAKCNPFVFRPEVSGEREQGRVCSLKESFGFVRCMDRPGDLFFHLTEAPPNINVGDEVDFFIGTGNR